MPGGLPWSKVDVLGVDDTQTGQRFGAKQLATTLATGVQCVVHEVRAERKLAFAREEMIVSHEVHFFSTIKDGSGKVINLNTTHRLRCTDPDSGATRKLLVKGFRKRIAVHHIPTAQAVVSAQP